ncbi:hypothetical protein [Photobacterium leiognathi]|uniref:hypothetical protein n=1 Tax=Photobacterium leiognathi TaxID=553611 RepID=UPI002734DCD5|nr:hypothetical protein [Photobacterium leiognathi]
MSEIQEINLNKFKVKLADTDDPVASKVSWNPVNPGGSNFKSQKMTILDDKIIIKKTIGAYIFALVFTVPGILALVIGGPYFLLFNSNIVLGLFMIVWGGMFGGVGILMLKKDKIFTIDKFNGSYYKGKEFDNLNSQDRFKQGYIKDIYAIQLINERIKSSSSNGRSSSYTSYELNLVFKDGERINIMDHGKGKDIADSAKYLGKFLNVPIWKAQY